MTENEKRSAKLLALEDDLFNGQEAAISGYADAVKQANPHLWREPLPPALDFKPDGATVVFEMGTYKEMEHAVLTAGLMHPALYNNLRDVFLNHQYPDRLDASGRMIRRVFLNLKDDHAKTKETSEARDAAADCSADGISDAGAQSR